MQLTPKAATTLVNVLNDLSAIQRVANGSDGVSCDLDFQVEKSQALFYLSISIDIGAQADEMTVQADESKIDYDRLFEPQIVRAARDALVNVSTVSPDDMKSMLAPGASDSETLRGSK